MSFFYSDKLLDEKSEVVTNYKQDNKYIYAAYLTICKWFPNFILFSFIDLLFY